MDEFSRSDLATTLGALHLGPPTAVSEHDPIVAVASAFRRDGVSCAVLEQPPLRVVTEYDLAGAWAAGCGPDDEVSRVATANPCWAPASATVAEAAAMMVSLGIRHLLVVDLADRPIGVVSMSQLFTVLVHAPEPLGLYASFAEIMLRRRVTEAVTFGGEVATVSSVEDT